MKKLNKKINEVSSVSVGGRTDTEPDFANWLAGGQIRTLGANRGGTSDQWLRKGGYTQLDFPKATNIYGDDGKFKLDVHNLDPGVWRKDSVISYKLPSSWTLKNKNSKHPETLDYKYQDFDVSYKDFYKDEEFYVPKNK